MCRTEFHLHTRYSHDSMMGKMALLAMCKIRRLDCVAITDHNEIEGAKSFRDFLGRHGIDVIVGEEVFTSEGEIIGLFLSKGIDPGLTPELTIAAIKEQDGIVYVPHPYDEKRFKTVLRSDVLADCACEIDCIEVHNGRNEVEDFSRKQAELAKRFGIVPVVGGDAHCFFEVGRNYCITKTPFSRDRFIETLESARFETRPCIRAAHVVTAFVRVMKKIAGGEFREVYRMLHRRFAR